MKFALAPLAGFTDAPFRLLCREGGADVAYTEMVSAAGLAHGSVPTRHMLETMPGEGPVACQIFGANERDVACAADFIQRSCRGSFCELNLNAGCPMSKVTCCGAGAKLMERPELVGRLLRAMAENTDLPVTLKTRLGPRPQTTSVFEVLDAAEGAGAAGMTVHARYASQMHGGEVHLETLAEVVRRSRIPVTGNGSVVDAESTAAMAATGVSAVMVGRAALKEPGVFARLRRGLSPPATDVEQARGLFRRHMELLRKYCATMAERHPGERLPDAEAWMLVKVRTHLFRYFGGCPGAASLRAGLGSAKTLAAAERLVEGLEPGRWPGEHMQLNT